MPTVKRAAFNSRWLPIMLLLPQLSVIFVFFYWPAWQAAQSSFFLEDPFGFGATFVGFDNYLRLFRSAEYMRTAWFTLFFTVMVTFFSLAIALLLAVKADAVIRGARTYRTLLMWVYAIAPPVAGFITLILFNQRWGPLTNFFGLFGWDFRVGLSPFDTGFAMILASVWKQIPINFIFFLSGLQSIPRAINEAAMIDDRSGREPLLAGDLSPAGTDRLFPPHHQHHLCAVRHVRDHRHDRAQQPRKQSGYACLQGLCRRIPRAGYRRLLRAVGGADGAGSGPDRLPVPAGRTAHSLQLRTDR
jgi:ABC-type glycerol-3-phosphate transport system permease component